MPRRVAIIGGGPAAMAAAYQLYMTQAAERITIYQMGWRLGGKCASGYDAVTNQLHEHGLHIFGGFYHETFAQLRQLYDEWSRMHSSYYASFAKSFYPVDGCIVEEKLAIGWRHIGAVLPVMDEKPGFDPPTLTVRSIVERLLVIIGAELDRLLVRILPLPESLRSLHSASIIANITRLLRMINQRSAGSVPFKPPRAAELLLARLLGTARSALLLVEPYVVPGADRHDPSMLAALAATIVVGLLTDDIDDKGFDSLNEQDLIAWLKRHGANARMLDSPYVRGCFDYAFAYGDGITAPPRYMIAAGTGLAGFLRMLLIYRGSVFYHLNGGAGAAVFTPYYEVLINSGVVDFKFFHKVKKLKLAADVLRSTASHACAKRNPLPVRSINRWSRATGG